MKTRLLVLLLVLTVRVSGQQVGRKPILPASGPARQPAETVLQTSLNIHGGTSLLGVTGVLLAGVATTGQNVQPVSIATSFDGYTRIDYGSPVNRSMVTTPDGVFAIIGGRNIPQQPHIGAYAQFDVFSVFGIRNTFASGADRGLMGNGTVNGRPTLRIHAGTDNRKTIYARQIQDEFDAEFDTETGLLVALHRRGYAEDSIDVSFITSYAFSDYREIQGLKLPYRIDRYLNGKLKETITVNSYTINPFLDRSIFQR